MFKTHFASAINEQGYLKVRPSLQFEDYDNIFALGDVADAPMNKVLLKVIIILLIIINGFVECSGGENTSWPCHKLHSKDFEWKEGRRLNFIF